MSTYGIKQFIEVFWVPTQPLPATATYHYLLDFRCALDSAVGPRTSGLRVK